MSDHALNPEQFEAVRTTTGRLLILAGAGSGKTRVLTARMAHLIMNENVAPESILGLTFTNKAAQEMRHRVSALVTASAAKRVTLSTFHSFCLQVLRKEIHHLGFTKNFSIYNEKDIERLVKMIARDELEHEGQLPSIMATMQAISKNSQKGQKAEEKPVSEEKGGTWHDQFAKDVYVRLKSALRAYNAVDFDHLLSLTVELFTQHPEVLERYQERYRYIMIDEYQDTNQVQFQLAELLSRKYNNLCVVGDDDQAIYGWRGADVRNILRFGDAKVIKLEQNYRSTNTILDAANAVIAQNTSRYPKKLWSLRGVGHPIEVFVAPSELEEAEAVAARIVKMRNEHHLAWSDIAILYRSNALSRSLELALMRQRWQNGDEWNLGVPFEIYGGVEFYERREVKDILAYLRAIINPQDQEALLRIVNLPRRGIGEVALDKMTALSRTNGTPLWEIFKGAAGGIGEYADLLSAKARHSMSDFIAILETSKTKFGTEGITETVRWLIERTQFRKSIEEDVQSDKMRGFKWENVEEFVSGLAEYEKKEGPKADLHDFISSMALDMQNDHFAAKKRSGDQVKLMTFHSAKGLEFDACFLVGLEDHLIPHEKSLMETGIEEERRLMYVALTRAKKWLTLSMTKERKRMGKDSFSRPSRFLFEIPKELLKSVEWHSV